MRTTVIHATTGTFTVSVNEHENDSDQRSLGLMILGLVYWRLKARVISRRWLRWWNAVSLWQVIDKLSHISSVPSPRTELGPQRQCGEARWHKASQEQRLRWLSYRGHLPSLSTDMRTTVIYGTTRILTISVDGCENDVVQPPVGDCLGSVVRFIWIWRRRITGCLHRAEPTTSRTGITQHLKQQQKPVRKNSLYF